MYGVGQKRSSGLGKPAKRRNDFIKEPVQELPKDSLPFWPKEGLDGCEIGGEVFSENRPPSGHAGISIVPN
jgi:hypothetical protein